MNRRHCLLSLLAAGLGGCTFIDEREQPEWRDERAFRIRSVTAIAAPEPLEFDVSFVENGGLNQNRDAEFELTLTNPTDDSVRIETSPIVPFGILAASSDEEAVRLWNEAYEDEPVDEVEFEKPLTRREDTVARTLAPDETIERTYRLRSEDRDRLPQRALYRVVGTVGIETQEADVVTSGFGFEFELQERVHLSE